MHLIYIAAKITGMVGDSVLILGPGQCLTFMW